MAITAEQVAESLMNGNVVHDAAVVHQVGLMESVAAIIKGRGLELAHESDYYVVKGHTKLMAAKVAKDASDKAALAAKDAADKAVSAKAAADAAAKAAAAATVKPAPVVPNPAAPPIPVQGQVLGPNIAMPIIVPEPTA